MAEQLPSLEELTVDTGSRVLLRADLNVSVSDGRIDDDFRIRAAVPTIRWLRDRGAVVVVCSHRGRPGGEPDPALSLRPAADRLGELLSCDVQLGPAEVAGQEAAGMVDQAGPGQVVLLENLRFDPGERSNDDGFVERLAGLADVYVNDAFAACHRAHASVVGPPRRMSSAAGRLLIRETEVLTRIREQADRPFVAALGGAKVADKLPVVEELLPRCDRILIGGAMAFTFLAAAGHDVGNSPVEDDLLDRCRELLGDDRLELPTDILAAGRLDDEAERRIVDVANMPAGWVGADIGPSTAESFALAVANAATAFWNGPMGAFEHDPFQRGTWRVAGALSGSRAFTVAGGGETVAALNQWGFASGVDHVSTGGGATLELLAHGDLPALEALRGEFARSG